MSKKSKLHWGLEIEAKAEAWYLSRNNSAVLVARNFRCRAGELDLVFEEPGQIGSNRRELVFVEVRARLPGSWETGLESVGVPKQLKLNRVIAVYLSRYRGRATSARLDVLAWDGTHWHHARNLWGLAGQA